MFDSLKDAMLCEGLDDWISLSVAIGVVHEETHLRNEASAVPVMMRVLTQLMSEGMLEAGEAGPNGFLPWSPGLDGHVARLTSILSAGGRNDWGHMAWFRLTSAGEARAITISHPDS